MSKQFKIFTLLFLFVFFVSLGYNLNKMYGYPWWSKDINCFLYGMSITVPLNFLSYKMCKDAVRPWEKIICGGFLWVTISAFVDEFGGDPATPNGFEHAIATLVIVILMIREKIKTRNEKPGRGIPY